MKPSSKAIDGAVVAYLCNFLEENDAKPWKVLKAASLDPKTDADWHTADAVNALYTAAELNLLSPGSGCPLKAGGMGGQDGLGADADAW